MTAKTNIINLCRHQDTSNNSKDTQACVENDIGGAFKLGQSDNFENDGKGGHRTILKIRLKNLENLEHVKNMNENVALRGQSFSQNMDWFQNL